MIGNNIEENLEKKPNSREIEKLKNEFPQFFDKDGEFLVDRFKEMLKQSDITLNKEGYELKFLGKSYARYLSSTKTETFLAPHTEENQKEENKDSENLYIIGDNLDALKHLLGSFAGKIKCIYIDPPYNTGSDGFVYPDNFSFDSKKLAEMIGIEEEEAERIINLKGKSSHSAWLTFMYPRLILARELLSDDGVIFISIDDNEQANLKLMCDEIFGEENNLTTFIRKTKSMTGDDGNGINIQHDYLYVVAKNKIDFQFIGEEKDFNGYSNPDNDPEGIWTSGDPSAKSGGSTTYFPIENPYTKQIDYPPKGRYWAFSEKTLKEYIDSGRIKFRKEKRKNSRGFIFKRYAKNMENKYNPVDTLQFVENKYMNSSGTSELESVIGDGIFSYPKPVEFIKLLVNYATNKGDIVLDFFSGSATTAHAVMQLNAEDGGNRKYILVQLPEEIKEDNPAYKAGYRTIDEIGRERIRRAAQKIKDETGADIDYGFKTYSLEEVDEDTLTRLDYFDDNPKLIVDDMVGIFDTENAKGKDAILATYLVLDGYGLSVNPESYKLDLYTADKVEKSLYIIDQGLQSTDVMELIRRIESLELDITRVVVYAQSIDFSVINELKKNLSNLRNNKTVELIERY